MERFLVTFGDTQEVYTEEQLSNFIKTAVIHNKDINNFKVNRLEILDVDVNEYGEIEPTYDIKEYEDQIPEGYVSLVISELADYAISGNCDNLLEKLDRLHTAVQFLSKNENLRDQFEVAALRILNSRV